MSNEELQGVTGARYQFMDTSPETQGLWLAMAQLSAGLTTLSTVIISLQQEVNQLKKEKQ